LGITVGCNPSGALNTLDDNTMVTEFIMIYHLAQTSKNIYQLLDRIETLPVKIMGDDSIMTDDSKWDGLIDSASHLGFVFEPEAIGENGTHAVPIHQAKFLNFGFRYVVSLNVYTFESNYDKMLAGLFFYKKSNSWRLAYAKACALRVMCYTNLRIREQLESYINFIEVKHDDDMRNEKILDDKISYIQLHTLKLRPQEIDFLIFGHENGISFISPAIKNFLVDF